jgi:2,4-dienoyl-CoA reductase-like NADH-dependent reductase (Old Yellow Enzyme family)
LTAGTAASVGSGRHALFEPATLGSLRLRNRFVMAPMTRKRSPDGIPGADVARYYQRRGRGEVGLIFSEGAFIEHPSAHAHDGSSYRDIPHFYGLEALRGWERVRKAVHATGALMIPQLWHVGAVRRRGMLPDPSVPGLGPREIHVAGDIVVRELGAQDAKAIAESYATSARMAREIGFDGIALHGAHGYLLDQFLWPVTNDRSDEYGGDLARRCRLACEVVQAIRLAVGPRFPIVFRFSQWKMSDYAARIVESRGDLLQFLSALGSAGVDAFDVSTRRFWEPAFPDAPSSLAALTRELSGRPTIAVGSVGLDQPHQSKHFRDTTSIDADVVGVDNVLAAFSAGDFDLVAVGRAMLADPDWVRKVRDGRMAEITPFRRACLNSYA